MRSLKLKRQSTRKSETSTPLAVNEIADFLQSTSWRTADVVRITAGRRNAAAPRADFSWRLHFLAVGPCMLETEDSSKPLPPSSVILEPPASSTAFSPVENQASFLSFELKPGVLRIRLNANGTIRSSSTECHQSWPETATLRNLLEQLRHAPTDSPIARLQAQNLVSTLALRFCEVATIDREFGQRRRHVFVRLKAYVNDNLAKDYRSLDAARELGFSVQYLNSLTKTYRGMSLNAFITFSRLEQLRHALVFGDEKISQLAPRFGFRDSVYLIQLFRRTYGLPPKKLRKALKQKNTQPTDPSLHGVSGFKWLALGSKIPEIAVLDPQELQATLLIANTTSGPVILHWLSPEGAVPIREIAPDCRSHLGASNGDVWMVADASDTPIGYFATTDTCATVLVT